MSCADHTDVIRARMILHQTLRKASSRHNGRKSANDGSVSSVFGIGASHFHLHHSGMCFSSHWVTSAECASVTTSNGHLFIMLYVRPVGPADELVGNDLIAPMNSSKDGGVVNEVSSSARAS